MTALKYRLIRFSSNSFGFFLFLLVLQATKPLLCAQNNYEYKNINKRLISLGVNKYLSGNKRTMISQDGTGVSHGQPEEIFSANDQLESNYDEYPMVVPKRAALLLDRLMVALHHALEKEHGSSTRLSEFYKNKNSYKDSNKNQPSDNSIVINNNDDADINQENRDSPYLAMYSDDDPTVIMDYDFNDLNSINRATGETLMAQSFQRRANMGLDMGNDIGLEGVSSLIGASSSSSSDLSRGILNGYNGGEIGSVDGGVGVVGTGRTASSYWRCYFNAVSCF